MIEKVVELKEDLTWEDGGRCVCVIKDDCDKYDDDNCDDCGGNMSCNVSIINFENFIFPFSIR